MVEARGEIDLTKYGYPKEYVKPISRINDLETDLLLQKLQKDPRELTDQVVKVLGTLEVAYALGLDTTDAVEKWIKGEEDPDETSTVRLAICANFIDRMRRENYPPDGNAIITKALFLGMKGEFGDLSMMQAMRVVEPIDLVKLHRGFNTCQVHEFTDAFYTNTGVSEELWKYFGDTNDPKIQDKLQLKPL